MKNETNPKAIKIDCAWQFAFNLQAGQKGTVGYISEWSGLGGLSLAQDILLWSPTPGKTSPLPQTLQSSSGGGPADQVKCVAVMESLEFGGESTDPIRISAYVSKDNQVKLRQKLVRPLPSTTFKLDYAVVGYDEDAKTWYSSWELGSSPSDAQINTGDGVLQLSISFEPTGISDILDINVYRLEFQMIPGAKGSQLKLASGPQHRYVTEWKGED
jgi:hypothetical protein